LFRGTERLDILDKKEVGKGIIGNIEYAINYLKEHVPVEYKITRLQRDEFPEYDEAAYREAIVNAVIHRDYTRNGEVAVEKLADQIFINNPGGLPPDMPADRFGKVSRPRNRLLTDLLLRTHFMERIGTGITRIQSACDTNNNPVEFDYDPGNFYVTIHTNKERVGEKVGKKVGEKVGEKITANQKVILDLVAQDAGITISILSEKVGIATKNIEENIARLKEKGLLKRVGPAKGGYWEVINTQ
ncbi:ATP-binding protein, partial [Candidatus Margulisiibacteriota bacterium]